MNNKGLTGHTIRLKIPVMDRLSRIVLSLLKRLALLAVRLFDGAVKVLSHNTRFSPEAWGSLLGGVLILSGALLITLLLNSPWLILIAWLGLVVDLCLIIFGLLQRPARSS